MKYTIRVPHRAGLRSNDFFQGAILDVVTSGQLAWDELQQRLNEPFKSLGNKCLVFGNGDDDREVINTNND